jgi:hypothetical protein
MSGFEQHKTTPTFGPRRANRLELMGIRFADDPNDPTGGAGAGYKAPESQEELDRIIGERLNRERDKFKDYDALKDKATKFDAAQAAGGSGSGQDDQIAQRLGEFETRVTAAEEKANTTQTALDDTNVKLLRAEVALEKGIAKDDLILLTATTKDDLDKQADRIVKLNAGSARIPGQGNGGGSGAGTVSAGRELFENKHKKPTS